ncbi:MAG: glycosyltransferase [Cyanobacteria bacterium P01_H01_bin.119]
MSGWIWLLSGLAMLIWIGLLTVWGSFWIASQKLPTQPEAILTPPAPMPWPTVAIVIPARNEAALIESMLQAHLTQDYSGVYQIILVDDQSADGTAAIAANTAESSNASDRLTILTGEPLPPGWTGKLWAMEQGFRHLVDWDTPPDYILLTDADIAHDRASLRRLVTKAIAADLDLVSLMVRLRCDSVWEQMLIPAFVFFFQMLYPFPWVNDPQKSKAAAAGGCMLLRFSALQRIDGLKSIRSALIDDCALGTAIKAGGPIWLGLSADVQSLRPYPDLAAIWQMVARSAYAQLGYSPWLLAGTVLGMVLVYEVPLLAIGIGLYSASPGLVLIGLGSWLLMAIAYWPTVKFYAVSPLLTLALPAIAALYTAMTIDSARRHWLGKGGAWKGRIYPTS